LRLGATSLENSEAFRPFDLYFVVEDFYFFRSFPGNVETAATKSFAQHDGFKRLESAYLSWRSSVLFTASD
jgi:hypothetical protein